MDSTKSLISKALLDVAPKLVRKASFFLYVLVFSAILLGFARFLHLTFGNPLNPEWLFRVLPRQIVQLVGQQPHILILATALVLVIKLVLDVLVARNILQVSDVRVPTQSIGRSFIVVGLSQMIIWSLELGVVSILWAACYLAWRTLDANTTIVFLGAVIVVTPFAQGVVATAGYISPINAGSLGKSALLVISAWRRSFALLYAYYLTRVGFVNVVGVILPWLLFSWNMPYWVLALVTTLATLVPGMYLRGAGFGLIMGTLGLLDEKVSKAAKQSGGQSGFGEVSSAE